MQKNHRRLPAGTGVALERTGGPGSIARDYALGSLQHSRRWGGGSQVAATISLRVADVVELWYLDRGAERVPERWAASRAALQRHGVVSSPVRASRFTVR
jgi:hypothetical protein